MENQMKGLLDSIGQSIKQLFTAETRPTSVVGIDIGASTIKAVQLKLEKGKILLETYGMLSLGQYTDTPNGQVGVLTPEQITTAVQDLLTEAVITTKDAAFSMASTSALVFTISLPSAVNERDYKEIVPLEARKYIPVPMTDVTIDWFILPKPESTSFSLEDEGTVLITDTVEILVVAIHNDAIEKQQVLMDQLHFNSSTMEVELFSAIRSCFTRELAPVLLIDLGAAKTKVSIVEYGVIKEFHIVNRGMSEITSRIATALSLPFEKAETLKREIGISPDNEQVRDIVKLSTDFILSEINQVMVNYEKRQQKQITKVILTGGGARMRGFYEQAVDNFRCEVIYGDPFAKVDAPPFLKETLRSIGPEFANALGVALRRLQ